MNAECISCIKSALVAHLDEGEAAGYCSVVFSPLVLLNVLPSEVMNVVHTTGGAQLRILMRWEDCKEKQDLKGVFLMKGTGEAF